MKRAPIERLLALIERNEASGCWIWRGHKDRDGYGRFRLDHRVTGAHRAAYILLKGEIPPGLVCDHLCDRRDCANPAHIAPKTHGENMRRTAGRRRRKRRISRKAA